MASPDIITQAFHEYHDELSLGQARAHGIEIGEDKLRFLTKHHDLVTFSKKLLATESGTPSGVAELAATADGDFARLNIREHGFNGERFRFMQTKAGILVRSHLHGDVDTPPPHASISAFKVTREVEQSEAETLEIFLRGMMQMAFPHVKNKLFELTEKDQVDLQAAQAARAQRSKDHRDFVESLRAKNPNPYGMPPRRKNRRRPAGGPRG